MIITKEYLENNPTHIFVFGDNTYREGLGGAAKLRNHKQSYGFITKKYPDNFDYSFYKVKEYKNIYYRELVKLRSIINVNKNRIFLISKLGAGLANKYHIWEEIIKLRIKEDLKDFKNVKFLF